MTFKDMFYRYVGPILAIPGMIFAVWGVDRLLVWNGIRHAKALCADPGPLIIYDRRAWKAYSQELQSRLTGDGDLAPLIRRELREEYQIDSRLVSVEPKNPLLMTTTYIREQLLMNGKVIAELNAYGANDHTPWMDLVLLTGHNRAYTCENFHRFFTKF